MKAKHDLLIFARTINDLNQRLPKGRGDCFDVGIWGGCGIYCPVFTRGDCESFKENPDEFISEIKNIATSEEVQEIMHWLQIGVGVSIALYALRDIWKHRP